MRPQRAHASSTQRTACGTRSTGTAPLLRRWFSTNAVLAGVLALAVFADGFESGDTAAWSSTAP